MSRRMGEGNICTWSQAQYQAMYFYLPISRYLKLSRQLWGWHGFTCGLIRKQQNPEKTGIWKALSSCQHPVSWKTLVLCDVVDTDLLPDIESSLPHLWTGTWRSIFWVTKDGSQGQTQAKLRKQKRFVAKSVEITATVPGSPIQH